MSLSPSPSQSIRADLGLLGLAAIAVTAMFWFGLYRAGWIQSGGVLPQQEFSIGSLIDYLPVWLAESVVAGVLAIVLLRGRPADANATGDNAYDALPFAGWLALYCGSVFVGGGLLSGNDVSWSQIAGRQGLLSPSHMVIFLAAMPAYIMLGGATWLYAETRLPTIAQGSRACFIVLIVAPFMFIPAVDVRYLSSSLAPDVLAYHVAYWVAAILWMLGVGILAVKLFRHVFDHL